MKVRQKPVQMHVRTHRLHRNICQAQGARLSSLIAQALYAGHGCMHRTGWLAGWLRAPWHRGPISGPKPNLFENCGVFYLGSLATAVYSQSRSAVRANSNLQGDLMGKGTSVPLTRLQRNITSVSNPQFIWRSEGTDLIKTAAGH